MARAIAAAVSRARRSGLERTTAGAAAASRSPSARACSRPVGVSGRSSSDGPAPPPHVERERAAQAQNRPVSCLDAQLPLRARGRLHRHAARGQPARRLHGRARSGRRRRCRRSRSSSASRSRSSCSRRARAGRCGSGSSRRRTSCPSRVIPTLGTAFVLGAPLQLGTIALETGRGIVPVELERDPSGRIVFGRMTQPVPTVAPFERERRAAAPRSASPARRCRSRSTTTASGTSTSRSRARRRWRRCGRTGARSPRATSSRRSSASTPSRGSGSRWKTRMFSPVDGVGEDAATGSAAGPLACHLARHGLVRWGEQLEISQGAEIGRPSTLYATAWGSRRRRSSASRWAARRSSSPAASSGFRSPGPRASMSGSSGSRPRQKRPPSAER